MMSKEAKQNYVKEMKKNFTENESVMIAQYQGLNVNELDALRKELREKAFCSKSQKQNYKNSDQRNFKKRFRKIFYWTYCRSSFIRSNFNSKILTKFQKLMIS